nr:aspartate/glutamate racemase family protein [Achromobacter sp. DMS1]
MRRVVLASNAPSVVVLDTLQDRLPLPVVGVYPPVREALRASRSGHVAVLGVQSLVSSAEIQAYIRREAAGARVETANASPLVEHVENGDFLARPAPTQAAVDRYMADLRRRWPDVDACTLSSTHLPWLRPYFERAAPGMHFIDPAQSVVEQLRPRFSQGQGRVVCLATESAAHPLSGLQAMLDTLGVRLKPELISLQ